jgi:hypothetical protein
MQNAFPAGCEYNQTQYYFLIPSRQAGHSSLRYNRFAFKSK